MTNHFINESVKEIIKDRIENHGFQIEDYLEKPPAPLKTRFLVIPGVLFAFSLFFLSFIQTPSYFLKFFNITGFGSGSWVCASTQIRFKNKAATIFLALGLVITILIANGMSLEEVADLLKKFIGD